MYETLDRRELAKHPTKQDTMLVKPKSPLHPIRFEKLNGVLIRETILKMEGPSGLDAAS